MATTNPSLNGANKALMDALMQSANNDNKKSKERTTNRKKLETRRAIEDYLESRRMRRDIEDYFMED